MLNLKSKTEEIKVVHIGERKAKKRLLSISEFVNRRRYKKYLLELYCLSVLTKYQLKTF